MSALPATLAVTAVLTLPLTACALGEGDVAATHEDPCPLRFRAFAARLAKSELPTEPFEASTLTEIQLLAPRSEGLAVVRSTGPEAGPVYLSYVSDEDMRTQAYPLGAGLSGLDWSTAAMDAGRDQAEVQPGAYRLVAKYVSAAGSAGESGRVVCVAISQEFELERGFFVHRFE